MCTNHHRHRRVLATSLIVVVLALVSCSSSSETEDGLSGPSSVSSSTATAPTATAPTTTAPTPSTTPAPTTAPAPTTTVPEPIHGSPDRIMIDSIGVDAPVVDLKRAADQTLEVPGWDDAGWWDRGPEPGERGPAIIAGHVDSKSGPAIFYRLRELQPGDPIQMLLDDGRNVTFTVDRTERFDKDAFPTLDIYGITDGPELRLITCDGDFDRSVGHYEDNLVVYATIAA